MFDSDRCFCKDCFVFSNDMKIVVTQENGIRVECGFCPLQASYVPFLWSCSKWKNRLKKLNVKLK